MSEVHTLAELKALLLQVRALATAHREARASGVIGDGTVHQLDYILAEIDSALAAVDANELPPEGERRLRSRYLITNGWDVDWSPADHDGMFRAIYRLDKLYSGALSPEPLDNHEVEAHLAALGPTPSARDLADIEHCSVSSYIERIGTCLRDIRAARREREQGIGGDGTVEQLTELDEELKELSQRLGGGWIPPRSSTLDLNLKVRLLWKENWNPNGALAQQLAELCDLYSRGLKQD